MSYLTQELHPINMELNRKHHRRRRTVSFSSRTRDDEATNKMITLHNETLIETSKSRQTSCCHKLQYLSARKTRNIPQTSSTLIGHILVCSFMLLLTYLSSSPTKLNAIAQVQQNFLVPGHNMENLRIPESQPIDSIVHQLKAVDRQNENRRFSYHMTGDTFSVDEQTGDVRLIKPLDRERQPLVVVVISVFDLSDLKNDLPVESKRRTIIVDDIDDSWPIFGQHKSSVQAPNGHFNYKLELSELAPVGSIVLGELFVTDADEGVNAEIAFECRAKQSTNQACEVFSLESRRLASGRYSLSIRTKQPLDFERVTNYRLALVARGKRPSPLKGVPLEAEAIISIQIINVQDEGPQFVNAPYSISMPEGLKQGTRLLNLVVQDGDSAPQRELSMIVVPGPFSEYFQVTKDAELTKMWYLETNSTLDREHPLISEVGNMFTISLLAAELGESDLPVATELELINALREPNYAKGTLRKENVTIMVLDLPDTRPIFVQASTGRPLRDNLLVLNVSESIVSGASLPNLDLAVHDLDQGINSRFNLSLIDSEMGPLASQAFALESGVIYGKSEIVLNVINSSLLDYEDPQLRSYKFQLVASKNQNPPLIQILELQINVLDANDNSPEFDRDQYLIEVPEGSAPGTLVATIRAKDRDSGQYGKLDYMLRGPGSSKFKLVALEGRIILNDCGVVQCLDYETQPSFSLTYEARDGGGRTKNVSVIINLIDINDHAPRFTEPIYKRELISDNLSSKQNYISPQLIVRAKDGDGPTQGRNNLTYRMVHSNLTGLDVDPVSGLVYLSQPLDLDYIVANLQQQQLRQQLPSSKSSSSRMPEKKIVFEAEVVAEDNGSPMLNSTAKILLVVKGNPDGAPQFKQDQYQAFVRENHPPNKPFFQVQAIDPDDKDSQLRYSLGYDLNDLVTINSLTGELSFKTKIDYDDFKGTPYNVTVYATDNTRPNPLRASAIVGITIHDVNDKSPKFEEFEYKATLVQGKTKVGDTLLQLQAVDLDRNAQLNYSILHDQTSVHDRNGQHFTLDQLVNSTTGYLSFMNQADRQQLVSNLRKSFFINKSSGAIELRSEPDYSFAASISIVVRVLDLNQEIFMPNGELQQAQATCTFFLQTQVDKSPIFAPPWTIERRNYSISIMEELAIGTPVFSLLAKDPTTNQRIELFEELHESDRGDYFRVDRSGVVLINRRIDYEDLAPQTTSASKKSLSLSVKATSNEGYHSVANLLIQVMDLNDNAPQFRVQNYSIVISEALAYPQEILTVQADDRDSSDFGQVYYSLSGYSSDFFTIDQRKGTIGIRKGVKLDRDTEPNHSLLVTASDCTDNTATSQKQDPQQVRELSDQQPICRKSSVFVNITLDDENDNDPVFVNVNKRGEFEALTSETVSVGSVITQAQAVDLDEGANGQVSYEIVQMGGSDLELANKLIRIDQDGYVSVAESLSGMGRANPYRITIRAYDHGKQSRQSFANLLLTINDVVFNDGVPKFIRPKADEVVTLRENAGPSTFVYQVQAIDPDEDTNGKLMYKFIQSTDTFEIDPFTGVIKTQPRPNFYLDRELKSNYTLIVVAQDLGSPPKQAHQVLTIQITDVNDNEPYFERGLDDPPLVLYVDEEIPADSLLGTIQAIDKDIGHNALIGYEIIEGNHNNMFRLSYEVDSNLNGTSAEVNEEDLGNNPCRIYSTGRLDREARESYTLTIKASSMSKLRNPFIHHSLKDPLGSRNPFNQYNASDLTKIRVQINLLDINDNRPVFMQQNAKSVVDSSAEIFSQLLVFKAVDADSSNQEIQYSILDALYHSDSRYRFNDDTSYSANGYQFNSHNSGQPAIAPISMKNVFDMDPRSGILRNSASLRPYIDGYFEVFVKADSGLYNQLAIQRNELDDINQLAGKKPLMDSTINKCNPIDTDLNAANKSSSVGPFSDLENCFVAVARATVFITHQRETFRFVFNKTKLNDRLDEFKVKVQSALEELMFEPAQAQASTQLGAGKSSQDLISASSNPRAEKVYLNTFNTDFFEREDGSLDFNTLTSCSQLVKFDDRSAAMAQSNGGSLDEQLSRSLNSIVPNQVINYEEVLNLLKTLNATQSRNQKDNSNGSRSGSLFSQYGLLNIERCLTDKTTYKMSTSERAALYFAVMIAVIGSFLAFIVSRMRKSYEKHLKLLQRSKYQYMNQYATLPPGMHPHHPHARPASHHMSLGALQAAANNNNNFVAPPYGTHSDYDGPVYDTWQM